MAASMAAAGLSTRGARGSSARALMKTEVGIPRARTPVWLWAFGAAALLLAHTGWQVWQVAASPYPERYDYDEGVYAATAAAKEARLYQDVFLSQPPLLITALRAAYGVFGTSLATARDTIVLFSLLWLLALFAIPAAGGRPRAGILAVCALLGSPTFLTAAHTVQMEAPSEALAATAVALAVLAARRRGVLWWLAAGGAAGLAVMTKLTAGVCAVPLLGAALATPSPLHEDGPAARGRRLAACGAGALIASAPLAPEIATRAAFTQLVVFHVSLATHLGADLPGHILLVRNFLVAEWPLAAGAAGGMCVMLTNADRLTRLLAAWLAAECVLVMALVPLWPHHLAVLLSPLSLLAGTALDRLAALVPRAAVRSAAAAALCAFAVYVGAALPAGSSGYSSALRAMRGAIAGALPNAGAVLTDDPMVPFLAHRPIPPEFIDTSVARFQAGTLVASALEAALGEPRLQAVLVWRGTFYREAPAFVAEAATLFPIRVDAGEGRALYLKPVRQGR